MEEVLGGDGEGIFRFAINSQDRLDPYFDRWQVCFVSGDSNG